MNYVNTFILRYTLFDPIEINDKLIDNVPHAKILGLHVSCDLKWNFHINEVIKKARKRLYCLSQLKRSGLGTSELVQFFRTCVRPITEYACPVFHDSLPAYLSQDLEAVQKRAMRMIFPFCPYEEALAQSKLGTLSGRRQEVTDKLFNSILENKDNKLHKLLPEPSVRSYNLRNKSRFKPVFKTNRFRNSFITYNALKA